MKKLFFTGGGGAGNEAIWRYLKKKYIIHFGDADKNRINPIIPFENRHEIPLARSKNYVNHIVELCKKLKIDIIVPGVDEELNKYAKNTNLFSPTIIFLPGHDFIHQMSDKYDMVKFLESKGIKVPNTILLSNNIETITFPCISKPRKGRGSGFVIEHTKPDSINELKKSLQGNFSDFILQEKIEGIEYTVQVISDFKFHLKAIVPVKIYIKRGITISASVEKNYDIVNLCDQIHESFPTSGVYNVQLMLNSNGEAIPFEINTRISTTFCLALRALKKDPFDMIISEKDISESYTNYDDDVRLERHWHNYIYT